MAPRTWQELCTEQVRDGPNCRAEYDSEQLQLLAASVKTRGLLQPILVRPDGDGWVCLVGSRRLQAARQAGLAVVPCLVLEGEPSPADILEDQLAENLLRADLQPLEQARAFRDLMALRGWSQRQLARHLHLNPGTISRALDLLTLKPAVQALVDQGELAASTAHTLVDQPAEMQETEGLRLAETGATRAEAQRRRKPMPKAKWELRTPGRWTVHVRASRKRASAEELIAELAGLVDELRRQAEDPTKAAA